MYASSAWGLVNVSASAGDQWTNVLFSSDNGAAIAAAAANGSPTLYPWTGWAVPRPGHEHTPCISPIKRFGKTECVTLRTDYRQAWTELWTGTLKAYADKREIVGIFLGDERIWNGASLVNVSTIAQTIREDWPNAIIYINDAQDVYMCNFNRLNETVFQEGECFPSDVDLFGFDYYAYDASSFQDSYNTFTQNVYPRMWSHQHVVPVTETFAPNTSVALDDICATNAVQFFKWGLTDDRVAGIFPWHYNTMTSPGPYRYGLNSLPKCLQTYQDMGQLVVSQNGTQFKHYEPHGPPPTCGGKWHSNYPWCSTTAP